MYHSKSEEKPIWKGEVDKLSYSLVRPCQALKKPMLYHDGTIFKLDEVFRFACNKLGGAHLDAVRHDGQLLLEKASRYATFGGFEHRIENGELGDVMHVMVEPDSTESLSGVHIAVIVASSMLVNIHFDGRKVTEVVKRT